MHRFRKLFSPSSPGRVKWKQCLTRSSVRQLLKQLPLVVHMALLLEPLLAENLLWKEGWLLVGGAYYEMACAGLVEQALVGRAKP